MPDERKRRIFEMVFVTYLLAVNGSGCYFFIRKCLPMFTSALRSAIGMAESGTMDTSVYIYFVSASIGLALAFIFGCAFAIIIAYVLLYLYRRIKR